jgi:hypothetical protein
MRAKTRKLIEYWLARMGESSTWQGVAFILTLFGTKFGTTLDWGQAAAAGGAISGFIKLLLPDQVKK